MLAGKWWGFHLQRPLVGVWCVIGVGAVEHKAGDKNDHGNKYNTGDKLRYTHPASGLKLHVIGHWDAPGST